MGEISISAKTITEIGDNFKTCILENGSIDEKKFETFLVNIVEKEIKSLTKNVDNYYEIEDSFNLGVQNVGAQIKISKPLQDIRNLWLHVSYFKSVGSKPKTIKTNVLNLYY